MNKVFSDPSLEDVKKLLTSNGLPTEDLSELAEVKFFGYGDQQNVVGVVGLESYGFFGLLRSLAVSANSQRLGYGAHLLDVLEDYSREVGLSKLYLLTETAELYFHRRGFSTISRSSAPRAIKETYQFSKLCPDSATFMCKVL